MTVLTLAKLEENSECSASHMDLWTYDIYVARATLLLKKKNMVSSMRTLAGHSELYVMRYITLPNVTLINIIQTVMENCSAV